MQKDETKKVKKQEMSNLFVTPEGELSGRVPEELLKLSDISSVRQHVIGMLLALFALGIAAKLKNQATQEVKKYRQELPADQQTKEQNILRDAFTGPGM